MIIHADFSTHVHAIIWRRRPILLVFTGTYDNPGRMEARAWNQQRYRYAVADFKGGNKALYHWCKKRSTLIAYAQYDEPIHAANWISLEQRGADWVRQLRERNK